MPRKQDESQRQASKASKKNSIDDASSHHDSGAEEALLVRVDDVVSNARSDIRHSDRVDDVVSNARSDNRQKGVIPLDTGLENVPSPGSQPPKDSSTGLIELPGVSSRDDRARHPSSEENTRSGNFSSQRIDYRSSPVRSFSHESGVPGTRSGRVQTSGLRHSPGGVSFSRSGRGRNNQRDKRSRSKSSSFFDSDESSSARYHSVSSSSRSRPGIGLEDILGKRNLIAIGLILEIPIDGNIKDVLGLVHIMTGDLDIVRLEAGSYHTHVISVTILVGLPIFKKRGDGFLALLLLIRMLFQTSYQGLLQIMSLKEKALLLLFRSLSQPLHIGLRTNLLLIGFLRVVLSILRKKMTEKSLTLRPLKKFLIFFPRLFVLGKMIHQFLLNPGQALIFLILQRIKNHHLYPSPNWLKIFLILSKLMFLTRLN